MIPAEAAIYRGEVIHERRRPAHHKLRYRVFSLLVDLDDLPTLSRRLRLFSHNRFNLFSLHDRDYGPGDGRPLAGHMRDLLKRAGLDEYGHRILLLSYPRMLGYVFNPLSVYFCCDAAGRVGTIAYEVSNTFGERKTYLLASNHDGPRASVYQTCEKSFYVSPFNTDRGTYSFHIHPPDDRVTIGVALRDPDGPLMRAHFTGTRYPLSDRVLAGLALRNPVMTWKVIGGIHWEALRLWRKGVPLIRRPAVPGYSVDFVAAAASKSQPLLFNNVVS